MISPEQILALAPDAASIKAGEGLAAVRKWVSLGRDDRAAWGLLQGSGKQPYQARVSLPDLASSCSCPSRKFPCKHGLGLLFLLARSPELVPVAAAPEFVEEWLAKRQEKAAKKSEAAEAKPARVDEEKSAAAALKREATREQRIAQGLEELKLWLLDLASEGLTAHNLRRPEPWEQRARRLNDAQLPGLARQLTQLGHIAVAETEWLPRIVAGLGHIHLALEAYSMRDSLSPAEQQDLMRYLGFAQRESAIDAASQVSDQWRCLGSCSEDQDRMVVRRTWLLGRTSGRIALLLDFAVGNQPLPAGASTGHSYALTLGFFPGNASLRATIADGSLGALPGEPAAVPAQDIAAALADVSETLSRDPWRQQFPMQVRARLGRDAAGQWWLADDTRAALPVRSPRPIFEWLALSAGETAAWFGEWDGHRLNLLSVASPC